MTHGNPTFGLCRPMEDSRECLCPAFGFVSALRPLRQLGVHGVVHVDRGSSLVMPAIAAVGPETPGLNTAPVRMACCETVMNRPIDDSRSQFRLELKGL